MTEHWAALAREHRPNERQWPPIYRNAGGPSGDVIEFTRR